MLHFIQCDFISSFSHSLSGGEKWGDLPQRKWLCSTVSPLCWRKKEHHIIQNFYIILDQKVIPCTTQTRITAFDELFKSHFVFAVFYDEVSYNFYTFIQTTMCGIVVGSVKESAQIKEIRARILHSAVWRGHLWHMFTCYICKVHHIVFIVI